MTSAMHIRAVRASKWYGSVAALSEVSFDLQRGIWGLLGPNGSGKTTLMRLVTGQIAPSLGEIRVAGHQPFANPQVLAQLGLCPESDALYPDLTALEHVTLLARMSGVRAAEAEQKARDLLGTLGLSDVLHVRVAGFSRGMRQRVKIAQALVHDPQLLVLDEPLTGTDPLSRTVILDEVRRRAALGALVLFSSHVLPEIESLTEQVVVLARGRLVALGSVRGIRNALDEIPHVVRVDCDRPRELAAFVCAQPEVTAVRFEGDSTLELETSAPDATYDALARSILAHGIRVAALTTPEESLEVLLTRLRERAERPAEQHGHRPENVA